MNASTVPCPTCSAATGAPCRALGRVGSAGSAMGSYHAKRKRAALALGRKASTRGLKILPRGGGRGSSYRPTDPSTWKGKHRIIDGQGFAVDERQYAPDRGSSRKRADQIRAGDAIFDEGPHVWRGVTRVTYFRGSLGGYDRLSRGNRVTLHFEGGGKVTLDGSTMLPYSETGLRGWSSAKHSEAYAGRYSPKRRAR